MSVKNFVNRSYGYVKNRQNFLFREVESRDYDEAIKIVSWFWTDAFVHKSMRVDENKAKVLAKYYVDSYFFNGLSIAVFDKRKGKIAGIAMSTFYNFGDERRDTTPKEHTFRSLQLATESEYFNSKSRGDGKFLEYVFGVTYPEYAKNNIATEATAILEDCARFHGCSEMGGICSSEYTYKLCLHLGHECKRKIRVSDFYKTKSNLNLDLNHEYFYWVSKSLKENKL